MIFDLLELINIHPKTWMSPQHCTPDTWFRIMIFICGSYVAAMYFVFAYQVLIKLKQALANLIQNKFPARLGIVFLLCALVHWTHSASYLHQYYKLMLLFLYPILCYYHTILLFSAKQAIVNLSELKTKKDIEEVLSENKGLKAENAKIMTAISVAISKNTLNELKELIK